MTSENGWSTLDGTNLDRSPIPGTDVVPVPGLRAGDVATVLLEVGRQFNETVAPVYNPGCWGYAAPIPIPGTSIISNHGSGTAIDFNAPSFPWKTYTMTGDQRAACRVIVNHMDGLVAWGGDFGTFVDEMHFEVNGSEEEISQLAARIRDKEDTMDKDTVVFAYRLGWNREPSQSELDFWVGKKAGELLPAIYFSNHDFRYGAIHYKEALKQADDLKKSLDTTSKALDEAKKSGAGNTAELDRVKKENAETLKKYTELLAQQEADKKAGEAALRELARRLKEES